MTNISRRGFLAATSAAVAASVIPLSGFAANTPMPLAAARRVLDIDGRAATVFGLVNASGGQGLVLDPGQAFRVDLTNALDRPTIIHWHGQIGPNVQDGVPDMPLPMLAPGETRAYDFAPTPGTHWMHAHVPVQEMELLAAPLIVRAPGEAAEDRQEVVLFLHDFSFRPAEEVLAQITGAAANGGGHGDHGGTGAGGGVMQGMGGMAMGGMSHGAMSAMAMDLNDFDFDAYLANDRTLSDPEVVRVERGGRVRLRVINAAAATVFWIDTGTVGASLVAVDGHAVEPLVGSRFGLAMGQRLDLTLDLPAGEGAFPVLALREGARERTGIVLATPGARIDRIAGLSAEAAPAFDRDLAQEARLSATLPLAARPADRSRMVMLGGAMQPYVWTIDGRVWGDHAPVIARSGERVELAFHNMSMMGHPMHLHGHAFQVVGINGRAVAGAVRDTVHIPPMSMVTVAVDAGEAARWMLHCHHMPHLATGMMTEFQVSASA